MYASNAERIKLLRCLPSFCFPPGMQTHHRMLRPTDKPHAWKVLLPLHFLWETMQTVGFGDLHFRKGIAPSRSILPGWKAHHFLYCSSNPVATHNCSVHVGQCHHEQSHRSLFTNREAKVVWRYNSGLLVCIHKKLCLYNHFLCVSLNSTKNSEIHCDTWTSFHRGLNVSFKFLKILWEQVGRWKRGILLVPTWQKGKQPAQPPVRLWLDDGVSEASGLSEQP